HLTRPSHFPQKGVPVIPEPFVLGIVIRVDIALAEKRHPGSWVRRKRASSAVDLLEGGPLLIAQALAEFAGLLADSSCDGLSLQRQPVRTVDGAAQQSE